jgi:hypothetical protein
MLPSNTENLEELSRAWQFRFHFLGAVLFGLALQRVDKNHYSASVGHVIDRIHIHQLR